MGTGFEAQGARGVHRKDDPILLVRVDLLGASIADVDLRHGERFLSSVSPRRVVPFPGLPPRVTVQQHVKSSETCGWTVTRGGRPGKGTTLRGLTDERNLSPCRRSTSAIDAPRRSTRTSRIGSSFRWTPRAPWGSKPVPMLTAK